MSKYTRRKFFKSIIPASVGVVSFLHSGNLNKSLKLDQSDLEEVRINTDTPTTYASVEIGKETFFIPMHELE